LTIAKATSTASHALPKGDRCGQASEKRRDDQVSASSIGELDAAIVQ
jgi:hypothetical protein